MDERMSKNRKLANSGISPLQLTEKFGSPLYVYDGDLIGRRCRELKPSFSGLVLYYASKANENPEIVRLIAKAGFGIETVSPEEIRVARRVGVPVSKITFTCSSIDEDELVWIVKQRVRVHLDSLTQVEMFGRNFPGRDISVRLNQGIGAGHHAHVVDALARSDELRDEVGDLLACRVGEVPGPARGLDDGLDGLQHLARLRRRIADVGFSC